MRAAVLVTLIALGLPSLGARASAQDDRIIEGYSDDGETIQPGPLHERSGLEELRARLAAAHERAPEDGATTVRLAVVESRLGHDARALELLDGVAAVSTCHGLARYDAGVLRLRLGRLAEAKASLADAAAVSSDRAEPAAALALASERLGDIAAAASAFDLAAARSQGVPAAQYALRAGALHERAGALDAALAAYRRASAADLAAAPPPGVVPALGAETRGERGHADAARVLLRLGRAAEARDELDEALEGREDAALRFEHGLARFLAGESADDDVRRLEATSPDLAKRLAEIVAKKRTVR